MTRDGNAEEDEESALEGEADSASEEARLPFPRWFYPVLLLALLWTLVLAVVFTMKVNTLSGVVTAVGAAASFATILKSMFDVPLLRIPQAGPRTAELIVAADLLASAGLLWMEFRSVDVLAEVALTGNEDLGEGGPPAVLDIAITRDRDGVVRSSTRSTAIRTRASASPTRNCC